MFCQKCGTQVAEDAQFCHKCGAKIVGASGSPPQNAPRFNAPPGEPILPTEECKSASFATSHPGNTAKQPFLNPSKKRSTILATTLGIVGGVFFLVLVCTFITGILGNNTSMQSQGQSGVALTEKYTDEENGFSFQYPSAWKLVEKEDFGNYFHALDTDTPLVFLANETEDLPEANSYMMVSSYPATQEDTEYFSLHEEQFAQAFAEAMDLDITILETSSIDRDGVEVKKICYIDQGFYYQSYFYPVGLTLYRVDFTCRESQHQEEQPFFNAIIDSYTIASSDSKKQPPTDDPAASSATESEQPPQDTGMGSIRSDMDIDCLTEFSNGRAWVQFQESDRLKGSTEAEKDAVEAAMGDDVDKAIFGLQNYHPGGNNRAALIDTTGKILWETDLTKNDVVLSTIGEFDSGVAYITFHGNGQEIYYIVDTDGTVTYARASTDDFMILGSGDGNFLVAEHLSDFDTNEWQLGLMDRNGNMVSQFQTYERTMPEKKDAVAPPTGEMPDPNVDYWAYLEYQDQLSAYEEYKNYAYEPVFIEIDNSIAHSDYLGEGIYRLWPDSEGLSVVLDMTNKRTLFTDYSENFEVNIPRFLTDFENGFAYAMDSNAGSGKQICKVATDGTITPVTTPLLNTGDLSFSEGLAFIPYNPYDDTFVDNAGNVHQTGVYCNLNGEVVIEFPQYHDGIHSYSCGKFQSGYAPMSIEGADGETYRTVIDKNGTLMFDPKPGFDDMFVSSDGKYVTGISLNPTEIGETATVFTIDGTPVLTVEYDEGNTAQEVRDGLLHVAGCYINVADGSTIGMPQKRVSVYGSIFHITLY